MAESEATLREVKGNRLAIKTRILPTMTASARRGPIGLCAAAAAFSMIVLTPSYGDTGQVVAAADPVEANLSQVPGTVNAETLSCKELKDRLERAGSLTILGASKGWGDTFYGPRVPQCQFWTRPMFSYVHTRDGLCGVGYICVEKMGSAGGGM